MSARSKAVAVAGVAAVALLLAGVCYGGRAPKKKAEQPLAERIVGEWTSDSFETQVGSATQSFCFRADGTIAVRTERRGGPVSNSGKYRLDAERVTVQLDNPSSSVVLRASWSDERLVLTDPSGEARSYRRTSKEC